MPQLVVDSLHGLNEVPEASPEGVVQPNEAVIAENVDPFRGPKGTVVPVMKFDRITQVRGAGIPEEAVVTGTIKFADKILVSLAEEDANGKLINPVLGYIDGNTIVKVPLNTEIGLEYDMIPKRWVVDPHTYVWEGETEVIEYQMLYLFGYIPEQENTRPCRIIYAKKKDGTELWWFGRMNALHAEGTYPSEQGWNGTFSYELLGPNQGNFDSDYYYYFVFEDIAGNLYPRPDYQPWPPYPWRLFLVLIGTTPYQKIRWQIIHDVNVLQHTGLRKVHCYRAKLAGPTGPASRLRYVDTVELNAFGNGNTEIIDTEPDDEKLGDLPEYTVDQMMDCWANVDKSTDGVCGFWRNRLVFSEKNEIMWSDTALNTPYGSRFLNFPSINMWSFADIGRITDLLEQTDDLVVLSTGGIAVLHGDTPANIYSEKVDDSSSVFFPNLDNDFGQWWWTAVNFDDWIIFVDSAGRPRIFDGRDARLLGDKVIIPLTEEIEGKMVPNNLDAVTYRNGYILATGKKIYVWCRDGDRWATWRRGAFKKRFLRPNEPWLNEEFVVNEPPSGYEGAGGLVAPDSYDGSSFPPELPSVFETRDRTYLYLFDEKGNLYSYGSREDDYPVNMRWRVPRIAFKGENYFKLLKLKWSYLPYSGYDRSSGSTPEEPVDLAVTPWLDDEEEPNEERRKAIQLVDEVKPGTYQCLIPLSVRANRLGYDLQVSHGRHFALNGYEIFYDPKGRRTYGR